MPRKTAKQRRSQETVSAILQAAAQVFQKEGYDKGTTDRIAERAGVSVGTVYQYFPDKDAILNVLFEQHIERVLTFLNALAEQVQSSNMSLLQAVRCMVRAVAEQQEEGGKLHRAVSEIEAIPPGIAARSRSFHERLLAKVKEMMQASPEVRAKDLDCAAHLVVVVVDSAIHAFMTHPPVGVTLASYIEHVSGMVMAYLASPIGG